MRPDIASRLEDAAIAQLESLHAENLALLEDLAYLDEDAPLKLEHAAASPPPPPPCGTQAQTVRSKDDTGGRRFDSSTTGNEQIEVPAVRGLPDLTRACMKQAEDPTGPPYGPWGQKGPVVPSSEVPQQPLQPPRPPPPANDTGINNQVALESTAVNVRRTNCWPMTRSSLGRMLLQLPPPPSGSAPKESSATYEAPFASYISM